MTAVQQLSIHSFILHDFDCSQNEQLPISVANSNTSSQSILLSVMEQTISECTGISREANCIFYIIFSPF